MMYPLDVVVFIAMATAFLGFLVGIAWEQRAAYIEKYGLKR